MRGNFAPKSPGSRRYKSASSTHRQGTLRQSSDKWGDRRLGGNDGTGNGECGLLLLLKSVEVDDDVALLLSCAVLRSMCTHVALQSELGGTWSSAVGTLWTELWFCCGRVTFGSTVLRGSEPVISQSVLDPSHM